MLVQITDGNGRSCQQNIGIVIDPVPPSGLFNNMVWSVFNFQPGNPSGSGSGTANHNAVAWTTIGAPGDSTLGELYGSMLYTGPAVNCSIAVNVAISDSGGGYLSISIVQNGIIVAFCQTWYDTSFSGTIPFVILAGTNSLIEIFGAANNCPTLYSVLPLFLNSGRLSQTNIGNMTFTPA